MNLDEKGQAYLGDWYLLGLGGGMLSTKCHFSIGIEYVLIDLRFFNVFYLCCMWDLLHLFAVAALRGDSALVARHTVVVVFVGDEGLGTDRLLTAVTSKTVLVPRGTVVLQHPRSCQRGRRRQINVCDCLLISSLTFKERCVTMFDLCPTVRCHKRNLIVFTWTTEKTKSDDSVWRLNLFLHSPPGVYNYVSLSCI